SGSFFDKLMGRDSGERLSAAALNAHNLAETLHDNPQLRLETYVLHTRYRSVVSVGGFDRADDPKMGPVSQLIQRLNVSQSNPLNVSQSNPFFTQPRPMEVPHP